MQYFAFIHKDPDTAYGVSFPDFPGCIAADDESPEQAIAKAVEALALHVRGMIADGEVVPDPRTLGDIVADPDLAEDRVGATIVEIPLRT